ncbi:MAG: transcription antitermination factor NusB [Oscillospiraceae bacterium]
MTRRESRENAFIAIFAASFGQEPCEALQAIRAEEEAMEPDAFGEGLVSLYQANHQAVNTQIERYLKGWDVRRIQKVSLAILRSSVAEMLFGEEKGMDSIIINEAVELAKKYGDEKDFQFINGLLGSVSREKNTPVAPDGPVETLDGLTETPEDPAATPGEA